MARFFCLLVLLAGTFHSANHGMIFNGFVVYAQSEIDGESFENIHSSDLNRVRTLIKANVLGLAKSILETKGPAVLPTSEWLQWERQLWALYRIQNDWHGLVDRVSQIPPSFPQSVHKKAKQQSILALIELQRGVEARNLLRSLLIEIGIDEEERIHLRKLLVESYLVDNLLNEASTAMVQFQSDYRSQSEDWLLLSAEIYLQLGKADDAINLLAPLHSPKARLLRVHARTINGSIDINQGLEKTLAIRKTLDADSDRYGVELHEVLAVEIYLKKRFKYSSVINELEKYLAIVDGNEIVFDKSFPIYQVQDLLDNYSQAALAEANRAGLLVGDPSGLFEYAVQLPSDRLLAKKAIYAHLLQQTGGTSSHTRISSFYVNALIVSGTMGVIPSLFGDNQPLGKLKLSGDIGLLLSNKAVEQGEIALAAFVNNSLTETPQGMDPLDWLLHVARISIIAGQYNTGTEALRKWINAFPQMTPIQIDQVLQPIFDLQSVNQHAYALALLLELQTRISTVKHEREMTYWIAESYRATRQYIKAAEYFLYSALLKDNGFDQWGESARHQAADSLQSANLFTDAKAIFEQLLKKASEESRKQQLQQRIQELWLLESSLKSVNSSND